MAPEFIGGNSFLSTAADGLNHLSFRPSSQYQIRLLDRAREVGTGGRGVKTGRRAPLRIPKTRVIDRSRPGTFHHAHETVRPLDRSLVTVTSENQNLGIARDGLRRRTPRHQVLVK